MYTNSPVFLSRLESRSTAEVCIGFHVRYVVYGPLIHHDGYYRLDIDEGKLLHPSSFIIHPSPDQPKG